MPHTCKWCGNPIGFFDAQTSDTTGNWHTRCRNECNEFYRASAEEFDDCPPPQPQPAPVRRVGPCRERTPAERKRKSA